MRSVAPTMMPAYSRDSSSVVSPSAIIFAAGAHHVEGRAQLVRDAGGELSDGGEPIGVAELLERRDEAIAHGVDLAREVGELVVLTHGDGAREVAPADAPRLLRQNSYAGAHEPLAHDERERAR